MASPDNRLYSLLEKYKGFIDVTTKIPVRDKESLSLVYSPGVGHACMAIKKDIKEVFELTNKANSLIIITDGSAYPSKTDQQNFHMLPMMEPLAIFYKQVYNIDTYPLVMDISQGESPEEEFETLFNLAPAHAGFELYGYNKDKLKGLLQVFAKEKWETLMISTEDRDTIEQTLGTHNEVHDVKTSTVTGGFLRAAMDLRAYHYIKPETILEFIKELKEKHAKELESDNIFSLARACVKIAAEVILRNKLNTINTVTPDDVLEKLENFYIQGVEGWVKHSPLDYVSKFNSFEDNSIEIHRAHQGVCHINPKVSLKDPESFQIIMNKKHQREIAEMIIKDPQIAYEATCKGNLCAIISNGTAILGFGDIGAEAGLPVMEGKSVLFKQLGGVDVMPICIREKNPEKVIKIIKRFAPSFAAINLEDIKAPDCFKIEQTLIKECDIPIFHDDQHGTAIVVVAALTNVKKILGWDLGKLKVIINGGGAAGNSICKLLMESGVKNIIVCDTKGAIYKDRPVNMNNEKKALAEITNPNCEKGSLEEVIKGAHLFIGVSAAGVLKPEMIKSMAEKPVVFALANPIPEIMPDEAYEAGAYIVATGRSDFPNQVNNSLVFPGLFRGAIDIRSKAITTEMKLAAAKGIAELVPEKQISPTLIIPAALEPKVPTVVAKRVAETGIKQDLHRRWVDSDLVSENLRYFMIHGRFNYAKSLSKCSIK